MFLAICSCVHSLRRPANLQPILSICTSRQSSDFFIGLGMVTRLGPKTGSRVKEGQRVVAVPWPTAGGEGTYQQYVATPEKGLVKSGAHGISHLLFLHALCLLLQVVVPDNVDDDMAAQFLVRQLYSRFAAKLVPASLLVVSQAGYIGCLLAWYPVFLQHTNAAEAVNAHDQTHVIVHSCPSTRLKG